MKLILSIVHPDDTQGLLRSLTERGFRATVISTTGGFLREGNATLHIGVDAEKVAEVLRLIKDNCHTRTRYVSPLAPLTEPSEFYIPEPVEVEVGGATVFVLDVESYEKF